MGEPHPALLALAAGHRVPRVDVDDGTLVESAVDHGMAGLLWSALTGDHDGWPRSIVEDLAARDLQTRHHQRRLWSTLDSLTALLDEMGIEFATIKGVTTEARWYDREGERPSIDVDLLLAPQDLPRVGEVVRAIQPSHPLAEHATRLVAGQHIQSIELAFDRTSIDLHLDPWKLWIPSRAYEEVWRTTQLHPLPSGRSVRVLSPEATLVELLLHMNKDNFRRLLGFVDIAHVIQRSAPDWAVVSELARLDGLQDAVALSLAVVAEVTEVEVPSLPVSVARSRVWRAAWTPSVRLTGGTKHRRRRRKHIIAILARGRAGEGLRSAARRVLPDAELVRYRHDDVAGAYLKRLVVGRARNLRALRGRR